MAWCIVLKLSAKEAKGLPSLTADWLDMVVPREVMWQKNTKVR